MFRSEKPRDKCIQLPKVIPSVLALLSVILLSVNPVSAEVKTFIGPGSSWHNPEHWSPSGVPDGDDYVVIGATHSVSYEIQDNPINSIITCDGKLTIRVGGYIPAFLRVYNSVTCNGTISVEARCLWLGGGGYISNLTIMQASGYAHGRIAVGATLSISTLDWIAGEIYGTGTVDCDGDVNILGAGQKTLSVKTFNVNGNAVWENGDIYMGSYNGTSLNNNAGAVFEVKCDRTLSRSWTAKFNNYGKFVKSSATGITGTTNIWAEFNNMKLVELHQWSVLDLEGGGRSTGVFHVDADAEVAFTSGTYTLDGTAPTPYPVMITGDGFGTVNGTNAVVYVEGHVTAQNFRILKGSLQVTANSEFTVSDTLKWSGGKVDGPGTVDCDGDVYIGEVNGSVQMSVKTFNANGNAVWENGDIYMGSYSGTSLNNKAGAVFEVKCDRTLSRTHTAKFNNHGKFVKSSAIGSITGETKIIPSFYNAGLVEVDTGTLFLTDLENFSTSHHTLTGGTYNITGILKFTDAHIEINEAAITLIGPYSAILSHSGGNALEEFATNKGSFTIKQRGFATGVAFTNSGSVSIVESAFITSGNYIQLAGSTKLDCKFMGVMSANLLANTDVKVQGGVLCGVGNIQANVGNGIITPTPDITWVEPGDPIGNINIIKTTSVSSNLYVQGAAGGLHIEIAGPGPAQYDRLMNRDGKVKLGGTLKVDLIDEFNPALGNDFTIMEFAEREGKFTNLELPPGFDVRYKDKAVVLEYGHKTIVLDFYMGWNFISCPGEPIITSFFELLKDTCVLPYALYWDPVSGQWVVTDLFEFKKAYWLASTGNCSVSVDYIPHYSMETPVYTGYNMFGSVAQSTPAAPPYMRTVPPNSLLPYVRRWNAEEQEWELTSTIDPGYGHLVAAIQDAILYINCPLPAPSTSESEPVVTIPEPKWEGSITVRSGKDSQELTFGMHPDASNGADMMDMPIPPVPAGNSALDAYFVGDATFEKISRDIKQKADTISWELKVESEEAVKLSWDITEVPDSVSLILAGSGGEETDMREEKSIKLPEGKYTLTVRASTALVLASPPASMKPLPEHHDVLPALIPVKNQLRQNYPNPFNPETWIPFDLAKPGDVKVSIYDSRGSLVRTIHLGHLAAGAYLTRGKAAYWDGRNDDGEEVQSGVYFYHLSSGDFHSVKKMIMVK